MSSAAYWKRRTAAVRERKVIRDRARRAKYKLALEALEVLRALLAPTKGSK